KALDIPWSAGKSLPRTEREFRALFWREIVRAGHRVTPAMGRLREEVLQTIAVRRAWALSAHVPTTGLDAAVVESLRGDALITSPDDNPLLVATAHDVLEDWAILQWLDEQHLAEASFKTLSDAIGTHPAVRRSFRKWVAELVERDLAGADRLLPAAVSDRDSSVQFRAEPQVSLLTSAPAPTVPKISPASPTGSPMAGAPTAATSRANASSRSSPKSPRPIRHVSRRRCAATSKRENAATSSRRTSRSSFTRASRACRPRAICPTLAS